MPNEEEVKAQEPDNRQSILLVDDEHGPRESIEFVLKTEFLVHTASCAADAINMVREKQYSVIILDIRMPGMDGIAALEQIRTIDTDVSIIMLTGYGTVVTAQQSILHGANQYMKKPPDVPELRESVRRQAEMTRLRRRQTQMNREMHLNYVALKKEMAAAEPEILQGRASVELVHDLTNPLMVAIGYARLLGEEARSLPPADAAQAKKIGSYADMVTKAAEYAHNLADNWRQSAQHAREFENVDLVEVVKEVHQVIFFSNHSLVLAGLSSAKIRGLRFQLMRVFQNLIKNGFEAGATKVDVNIMEDGTSVLINIRDNGKGMSVEECDRARRGNYTNKEAGLGVGLNICQHIVHLHGGSMDMQSHTGRGTEVHLRFPLRPLS